VLIDALLPSVPEKIRALAAWCIGTAVKNNYEYQLYTLEHSDVSEKSVLSRLTEMLKSSDDMCVRKALYAISAASRGNADVQGALQQDTAAAEDISVVEILYGLVGQCRGDGIEIERKVWTFISDMLDEVLYIKTGPYPFDTHVLYSCIKCFTTF